MALFKVIRIIDGNTIQVSPGWTWQNVEGSIVRIKGYVVSPEHNSFAASKLTTLLLNKSVELKNALNIKTENNQAVLTCSVYLNEIDASQYFPELRHV